MKLDKIALGMLALTALAFGLCALQSMSTDTRFMSGSVLGILALISLPNYWQWRKEEEVAAQYWREKFRNTPPFPDELLRASDVPDAPSHVLLRASIESKEESPDLLLRAGNSPYSAEICNAPQDLDTEKIEVYSLRKGAHPGPGLVPCRLSSRRRSSYNCSPAQTAAPNSSVNSTLCSVARQLKRRFSRSPCLRFRDRAASESRASPHRRPRLFDACRIRASLEQAAIPWFGRS